MNLKELWTSQCWYVINFYDCELYVPGSREAAYEMLNTLEKK